MSSWDLIRQKIGTFRAGEDLTSARGKAVVLNSFQRWQIAGLTGPLSGLHHGILTNNPGNGEPASVQTFGVAMAKLGGTVTAGRFLDIDANGDLVEVNPDGQVGVALESGIAGSVIPVLLMRGVVSALTVPVRNDAIKIRRSTNYTLTTAFVDIPFDETTVETDPAILEHNNTNIDDIDVKEDGTYLIFYDFIIDPITTVNSNITCDARVRKDDTTVIPGSPASQGAFRATSISGNEFLTQMSQSVVTQITAGQKLTLQLKKTNVGGGDQQYDVREIHWRVVRLL